MKRFIFAFLLWLLAMETFAQLQMPALSPAGEIIQQIGYTTIHVQYERPAARGRTNADIFGKLVPYGKVWRTGAGNCTTISFSTNVVIGGKIVAKGKYALFTIPDRGKWTIILNKDTLAQGAYNYDSQKDVVRIEAPAIDSQRYYESLTIDIDFIPNNAKIYISWLNTQTSFEVNTGTDEYANAYIAEKLANGLSTNPSDYEAAILYGRWHGRSRVEIMNLIEKGIALKNDRVWYYWKVEELMKDKKWSEARTAAKSGIETIKQSTESDERKKELIKDFEAYLQQIDRAKH